jgi:hypothetical protein
MLKEDWLPLKDMEKETGTNRKSKSLMARAI